LQIKLLCEITIALALLKLTDT